MTTIIEWHDAKTERPKKSGMYLTITTANYVHTIEYSKKHDIFNTFDEETKEEAKQYEIDVKYWAELPKFPDEVLDNG